MNFFNKIPKIFSKITDKYLILKAIRFLIILNRNLVLKLYIGHSLYQIFIVKSQLNHQTLVTLHTIYI